MNVRGPGDLANFSRAERQREIFRGAELVGAPVSCSIYAWYMTVIRHGPGTQYGPSPAPTVPGGPPAPPPGPPPSEWRYPPPPTRRGKGLPIAVAAAIVLATAALVIGIVDLTLPSQTAASVAPSAAPAAATPTTGQDTTAADRGLCTAIAPLMSESDRIGKTYVGLGPAGTPQRDAALPKFISDTQDWITRIQPILDQHRDASPFFQRSLQRFIDDQNLIVSDIAPGPLTSYAEALWSDSLGAYSGPLHICDQLGIKW
jgi:hypothetical protein